MKKLLILALCVIGLSATAQKIKGSDTVLPLAQKEAESYLKKNASASISITGGGSGVGIAALIDGSTDIAMASRKIKFDEKLELQKSGNAAIEKTIALDALVVVVNPRNPVSKLTRAQLEAIFTGKITSWKELGGLDQKIVVYSRETSSGTYEFFKQSVLQNKNYMAAVLSMPATGAIIQSVSQTPGAIGYVGHAYLTPSIKAISVSYDGKNYIEPTYQNAKSGLYPIVRPLLLYYTKKSESKAKGLLDFMMSAEGQKIVKSVGYIDVI